MGDTVYGMNVSFIAHLDIGFSVGAVLLLLFLIVAYFSLFVQAHPVGKGPKAYGFSWQKPRVIRTESDTFYLYLPQATIWK